jgi:hypothetical protein
LLSLKSLFSTLFRNLFFNFFLLRSRIDRFR